MTNFWDVQTNVRNIYQITETVIAKHSNLHIHRRENLKNS
jgi:hypothetical protein